MACSLLSKPGLIYKTHDVPVFFQKNCPVQDLVLKFYLQLSCTYDILFAMCDNCKCKSLLKRKDISATKLRRLTIKVLTIANKSLTPSEILKEIRKIYAINKVTLYRILDLLEQKEIVRKMLTPDNVSRYELIDPLANGKQSLSPRFICRICKTIIPIDIPEIQSTINKKLGSEFYGPIEIAMEGICPNCRKERK